MILRILFVSNGRSVIMLVRKMCSHGLRLHRCRCIHSFSPTQTSLLLHAAKHVETQQQYQGITHCNLTSRCSAGTMCTRSCCHALQCCDEKGCIVSCATYVLLKLHTAASSLVCVSPVDLVDLTNCLASTSISPLYRWAGLQNVKQGKHNCEHFEAESCACNAACSSLCRDVQNNRGVLSGIKRYRFFEVNFSCALV